MPLSCSKTPFVFLKLLPFDSPNRKMFFGPGKHVLNDAVIGENKARMAPMSHSPMNFIRPVEKVLNLLIRFFELKKNV